MHAGALRAALSDREILKVLKCGTKLLERRLHEAACLDDSVAVFALARKLAVPIYRMLYHGRSSDDFGAPAFESRLRYQRLASLGSAGRSPGYKLVAQTAPAG